MYVRDVLTYATRIRTHGARTWPITLDIIYLHCQPANIMVRPAHDHALCAVVLPISTPIMRQNVGTVNENMYLNDIYTCAKLE